VLVDTEWHEMQHNQLTTETASCPRNADIDMHSEKFATARHHHPSQQLLPLDSSTAPARRVSDMDPSAMEKALSQMSEPRVWHGRTSSSGGGGAYHHQHSKRATIRRAGHSRGNSSSAGGAGAEDWTKSIFIRVDTTAARPLTSVEQYEMAVEEQHRICGVRSGDTQQTEYHSDRHFSGSVYNSPPLQGVQGGGAYHQHQHHRQQYGRPTEMPDLPGASPSKRQSTERDSGLCLTHTTPSPPSDSSSDAYREQLDSNGSNGSRK
jgi:hypothetical protein